MTTPGAVDITPATAADVPELQQIAQECGLHVDFPAELARAYALLRVARLDGRVVGFLLAWRAADELHLTDLGVTAAARRRGIARQLLADLRGLGAQHESRVILLEVRESNEPALELYRVLDFVELDRRARYYPDTDEDAVVMQLELR
ncbi:MAG TPA: ribosomal protein S18-alanine N-acetyltransferase [Polyangiaceae bacterium]|nr:ribosomal protein S18-alanine N-acetyltransferase [Polyangiaceae bacterium]